MASASRPMPDGPRSDGRPAAMKALLCRELGTGRLDLAEVDVPRAGRGQLVIDVKAAAANFPDALMLQGKYQFKPPLPFAPGCELAGVVREVGEGVTGFAAGQ